MKIEKREPDYGHYLLLHCVPFPMCALDPDE